jgi:hypothetical protein
MITLACLIVPFACSGSLNTGESQISNPREWNSGIQDAGGIDAGIIGRINNQDYFFGGIDSAPEMLLILDLTTPDKPEQIALFKMPGVTNIHSLYLSGTFLYALTSDLRIIDVSNPANPREISVLSDMKPTGIVIYGHYAYICERNTHDNINNIIVVDVFRPEDPKVINTLKIQPRPYSRMQVSNSKILWQSSEGIHIMDISNPILPVEVGLIRDPGFIPLEQQATNQKIPDEQAELLSRRFCDYSVQEDLVYIASYQDFHILDISDPSNMRKIASYKLDDNGYPEMILTIDKLAYWLGDKKLNIFDVSNPYNLQMLQSIDVPRNVWRVASDQYKGFAIADGYFYGFGRGVSMRHSAPHVFMWIPLFKIIPIY